MSGIVSYCFDFRGGAMKNKSEGSMLEMSIMTEKSDLLAVYDTVRKLSFVDSNNIFLLGESQGGFVSAITAAQMPDKIRGLILMYPAFSISEGALKKYKSMSDIPDKSTIIGGTVGRKYYEDILNYHVYSIIEKYTNDAIIFHGGSDRFVSPLYSKKAACVYKSAELVILKGEGHSFKNAGFKKTVKRTYKYIEEHLENSVLVLYYSEINQNIWLLLDAILCLP